MLFYKQEQENQPEFPKIEYKYHVEFKFIEQPIEHPDDSKSVTPLPDSTPTQEQPAQDLTASLQRKTCEENNNDDTGTP